MPSSTISDVSGLLSLRACAERLPRRPDGEKICLATLYRWVRTGKLPAVKIGKSYYVHPEDLADMARPVEVRQRVAPDVPSTRAQRAWEKEREEILRRHGLA